MPLKQAILPFLNRYRSVASCVILFSYLERSRPEGVVQRTAVETPDKD